MTGIVFIGDELSSLGYRLAGAEVFTPSADQSEAPLRAAVDRRPALILITAEYAAQVDAGDLDALLRRASPLVAVIPDARESVPPPDWAARTRRTLGIEEP